MVLTVTVVTVDGGGDAGAYGDTSTDGERATRRAITYVSGMTDRFAFATAVELLGWRLDRLPRGVDAPASPLLLA